MLASVLRSETAIRVSIRIMDAFVSMRHFLINNADVFRRLSTIEYHQLEMMQHQYELNINYTSTMASINQSNSKTSNDLIEEDYQREVVEYKRNDTLFEPTTKQLPKDALGLPKFVFTDPTK